MKKLANPIVVALLALGLAACGPSTSHTDSGTPTDHPSTTTGDTGTGQDSGQNPGQDSGPGNDGATSGDSGSSTDPCPMDTDCDSCTNDSSQSCGWCANSNSCHAGSMTGPTDTSCTTAQWSWTGDMCPGVAAACAAATDCASCTGMGNCGFCMNTGMCRVGTGDGPTDMSCTSAQWAWTGDMCGGDGGTPTDAAAGGDAH